MGAIVSAIVGGSLGWIAWDAGGPVALLCVAAATVYNAIVLPELIERDTRP